MITRRQAQSALLVIAAASPGQAQSAEDTPPIACDLNAIPKSARARHSELSKRLRDNIRSRHELRDGFAFQLETATMPLVEVAEWIALESKCCPFLSFQLAVTGREPDWRLTLTGPRGVKELLAQLVVDIRPQNGGSPPSKHERAEKH